MGTHRITEQDIVGMPVLATGYKVFQNDWTAKWDNYDYKDKNGIVLNTIHKVDGEIAECKWGLHFCEKPEDCFSFYECVPWNKFAKVEAYGKVIKASDGTKSIAQILKIVEVYSFDDFTKLVPNDCQIKVEGGYDVTRSTYIMGGAYIKSSSSILGSKDINGSCDVSGGDNIVGSSDIYGSRYIAGSHHIYGGDEVDGSIYLYGGSYITYSVTIEGGNNIHGGYRICGGNNIWGGYKIKGGDHIWGASNCNGISRAIFCYNKSGSLMIFNKKCTVERFKAVFNNLRRFKWFPKFNNAIDLKGNLLWNETNIPEIKEVSKKVAWSTMPKEMEDYIKSLPEYNEKIFKKVTGRS